MSLHDDDVTEEKVRLNILANTSSILCSEIRMSCDTSSMGFMYQCQYIKTWPSLLRKIGISHFYIKHFYQMLPATWNRITKFLLLENIWHLLLHSELLYYSTYYLYNMGASIYKSIAFAYILSLFDNIVG